MSAPRVVLHVGLPKTGTSFVQATLRANLDALAAGDVRLPENHGEKLFQAVLHVTERSEAWGRSASAGRREWDRLVTEVRGSSGTTIVSSETLCLATDDQIRRILADLHGVDVDVIVTVRDPARQIPAEWQEGVKHGRRSSYPRFLDTILGDAPGLPKRAGARTRFWNAQNPVLVLDRWGAHLGSERVHVVVNPAPGAEHDELWRRFSQAADLDHVEVRVPGREANASLGRVQVEVLRRVNRRFVRQGNEKAYGDLVKRLYAGTVLRGQKGEKVGLPDENLPEVRDIAQGWVDEITAKGYPVAGQLSDLVPGPDAGSSGETGATQGEMLDISLDATADLLLEIERLRGEIAELKAASGSPVRSLRRGLSRVGGEGR
ncbi:MAG: hypothetical protein WB767_16675 [Nocardioides sp.]